MENMDFTPHNLYRLNTDTVIANSGRGTSPLTKPAGVEVASIIPGKKHSVYIPSEATFTTSFNLDASGYTILFYAKPSPGVVLSVDGNEVIFTGHSYRMTNVVGEQVEIPVRSNAARLIIFTYSDLDVSLFIDDRSGSIEANTTTQSGPLDVSLLASGGIVDNVAAVHGLLSTEQIRTLAGNYAEFIDTPPDTTMMFDTNREYVVSRVVFENLTLEAGQYEKVELRANEANSFKIEYEVTGSVIVEVNGQPWTSGLSIDEFPDTIHVYSETGGVVRNLVITEYYDNDLVSGPISTFSTDRSSGTPAPTHRHDDAAANDGNTVVTLQETTNTLAGWFKAGDGAALPGVSMYNGKLINANFTGEVFEQATAPAAGTYYRWMGPVDDSASEKVVDDVVIATNLNRNPGLRNPTTGDSPAGWGSGYQQTRQYRVLTEDGEYAVESVSDVPPSSGIFFYSAAELHGTVADALYAGTVEVRSFDGPIKLTNVHLREYNNSLQVTSGVNVDVTEEWTVVPIPSNGIPAVGGGTLRFLAYTTESVGWAPGKRVQVRRVQSSEVEAAGDAPSEYVDAGLPDDRSGDLWVNTTDNSVNVWNSDINDWTLATSTGLYVNGQPYTDQEIRDWYFLAKTGAVTGEFTSTVPTHALYASERTLTAAQIDDLYESFVGNPTLTVEPELLVLADAPALLISTEWNIVASG